MALSKGAQKFGTVLLLTVVLGGAGYKFFKTPPKAITNPAPIQMQETSAKEVPAPVVQAVPTTPVEQVSSEAAPVKKHTAGHVAKHVQVKHQTHTKFTPHHSGSTSTHSVNHEEDANQKALEGLAKGSL